MNLVGHIVEQSELGALETVGLGLESIVERLEQGRLDVVVEHLGYQFVVGFLVSTEVGQMADEHVDQRDDNDGQVEESRMRLVHIL